MKILLQDAETGLYLSRGGSWSDNPAGALAFLNEVRAKDYGIYHHLSNAKVMLWAEACASNGLPTPGANAAHTNMNTQHIMNPKEKTTLANTQTAKPTPRKPTRPKSPKAALPAQQVSGTLAAPARPTPASTKNPRNETLSLPEQVTVVAANINVGLGNLLFIRSQGDGLSWLKGVPLNCVDPTTWVWSTTQAREKVIFKLLLNDEHWAKGEDVVAEAGRRLEIVPCF